MKVKVKQECANHPIIINTGNCDHCISTEEAEKLAHDLNKAIIQAKGIGPNDEYFEHEASVFIDDDIMKMVETEEGFKRAIILFGKQIERDARNRDCELVQEVMPKIHNMEYR